MFFTADDGMVFIGDDFIRLHAVEMEIADAQAVRRQPGAQAAEFVVDDIAVVKDDISFFSRVFAVADDVDAGPLIDEQNFDHVLVHVHTPRHLGRGFIDHARIPEPRHETFRKNRLVLIVYKILQHNDAPCTVIKIPER